MFYIKALHIIFIVTWFSGLFYIVRIFIYNTEAQSKSDDEKRILTPQFNLMAARLWRGITIPSAILTLIFGSVTLYTFGYLEQFGAHTWLHIKLVLVLLLYGYTYTLHKIFQQQQKGIFKFSSQQLRIWNEVATIFLVAIVMLVVVKSNMSWIYGLIGLVGFVILLMSAIKIYKQVRVKKEQ